MLLRVIAGLIKNSPFSACLPPPPFFAPGFSFPLRLVTVFAQSPSVCARSVAGAAFWYSFILSLRFAACLALGAPEAGADFYLLRTNRIHP